MRRTLGLVALAFVLAGCGGNDEVPPAEPPTPTATTPPSAAADDEKAAAAEACKDFVIDEVTPVDEMKFPVVAPRLEGDGVYKVTGVASTDGDSLHFQCMVMSYDGAWRLVTAVEIT
jgi:hypothetical protein